MFCYYMLETADTSCFIAGNEQDHYELQKQLASSDISQQLGIFCNLQHCVAGCLKIVLCNTAFK